MPRLDLLSSRSCAGKRRLTATLEQWNISTSCWIGWRAVSRWRKRSWLWECRNNRCTARFWRSRKRRFLCKRCVDAEYRLVPPSRIMLTSSWDHSKASANLEAISKRCIALVNRIWDLSKQILSSEGSNTADHEIARIYDMLEEDVQEEDQDTVHINLLSNCWRAIKESR